MDSRRRDAGQVLPMTTLLLIPLLIVAAFGVDAAFWFVRAAELQKAADLASLAGAETRGRGGSDREVVAAVDELLAVNDLDGRAMSRSIDLSHPREVRVRITDGAVTQFISQLFTDSITISRSATAAYDPCVATCTQPVSLPPPVLAFPNAGSGDGFVPSVIAGGDRFLILNHHTDARRKVLLCVDVPSQRACPRYPADVNSTTSGVSKLATFEERDEVWWELIRYDAAPLATHIGLGCTRISTGQPCGEFIYRSMPGVTRSKKLPFQQWTTPVTRHGNQLVFIAFDMSVGCFDVTTRSACPGYPVPAPTWASVVPRANFAPSADPRWVDVILDGDRLVAFWPLNNGRSALCWDLDQRAPCSGFRQPVWMSSSRARTAQPFVDVDADARTVGYCLAGASVPCVSTAGRVYDRSELERYMATDEGTGATFSLGTRVYSASWKQDAVYCVDLVKATSCGYTAGHGWKPYGVTLMPNTGCLVGYGDAARIFVVSRDLTECDVSGGQVIVPPCACGSGASFYGELAFDPDLFQRFAAFVVTVTDRAGRVVAGPIDVLSTQGKVDLSGVDPAVGPLTVAYEVGVGDRAQWTRAVTGSLTMTSRPVLTE
ncbi:MAG: pilus assembly protein TadG-related protein [Acidimicrobiales bacterium]